MEQERKSVQDYWRFTRELRAQLNAVQAFERQFFELDDLCEWSLKNQVTCLNDNGERVSVVDDCLGGHQLEVYRKLHKAVGDLDKMLTIGLGCFTNGEENKNE